MTPTISLDCTWYAGADAVEKRPLSDLIVVDEADWLKTGRPADGYRITSDEQAARA